MSFPLVYGLIAARDASHSKILHGRRRRWPSRHKVNASTRLSKSRTHACSFGRHEDGRTEKVSCLILLCSPLTLQANWSHRCTWQVSHRLRCEARKERSKCCIEKEQYRVNAGGSCRVLTLAGKEYTKCYLQRTLYSLPNECYCKILYKINMLPDSQCILKLICRYGSILRSSLLLMICWPLSVSTLASRPTCLSDVFEIK